MSSEKYSEDTIMLMQYGRQDCKDMHSWGPGMRQCYIIHYIIKGAGYIKIKDKYWRIKAGQSFIIYPFTVIYYYPDTNNPWEYVWIDFIGKDVAEYLKLTSFGYKQPVSPVISYEKIFPLFDRLSSLDIYNQNKMEANGVMLAILGLYADFFPSKKCSSYNEDNNRLRTAIQLIHVNYHKTYFNVEMLCSLMNINRVTLYRTFKNKLSTSPNNYILEYRLKQAKTMLGMGISVKSTSISCGFSDQFYFSKVYKKYNGTSPSEYINKTPVCHSEQSEESFIN